MERTDLYAEMTRRLRNVAPRPTPSSSSTATIEEQLAIQRRGMQNLLRIPDNPQPVPELEPTPPVQNYEPYRRRVEGWVQPLRQQEFILVYVDVGWLRRPQSVFLNEKYEISFNESPWHGKWVYTNEPDDRRLLLNFGSYDGQGQEQRLLFRPLYTTDIYVHTDERQPNNNCILIPKCGYDDHTT